MESPIVFKESIQLEYALIESALRQMPRARLGRRNRDVNSPLVIRYSIEGKRKEVFFQNATNHLKNVALKRQSLENRRLYLKKYWDENMHAKLGTNYKSVVFQKNTGHLNSEFFYEAESQALNKTENHLYLHNGFWMRSRAELLIANTLDEIGLEYKYEVRIPGTDKYADFLIHFPSLDACVFLEFLGKAEDNKYFVTNMVKISDVLSRGFQMNRDLLLLYGTDKTIPDRCEIETIIGLSIYKHCQKYLQ